MLIKAYQSTIIGVLAGHTHTAELKMLQNRPLYFMAGLSTSHGNRAAINKFSVDKKNGTWQLSRDILLYLEEMLPPPPTRRGT